MYVNGAIIAMSYTDLIRIINNNNNRPPACTSFSYGTGNKVSRNDGLIAMACRFKFLILLSIVSWICVVLFLRYNYAL